MSAYDAVIAGAGPAGSALAAFLGRAGWKVLLADRARFPRPKPCGEFMSPEALPVLESLGVLGALEGRGIRRLTGLRVSGPRGGGFRGDYVAVDGFPPFRPYGVGVKRHLLDETLLRNAASVPGVEVREGFRVLRLLRDSGRVRGAVASREGGREEAVEAPLVVGADGIRSAVCRDAGLARPPRRRRFALVGYWEGLADEGRGELHLGERCYAGIAPVEGGLCNVNLVVDGSRLGRVRADPGAFYEETLRGIPGMRERLAGARRTGLVRVTGPVAWGVSSAVAPGVLLVGDAADFVDPFTGEGLFMALRGAQIAAEALAASGPSALPEYARRREAEFGEKLRACRGLQRILYRPRLMDWLLRRLDARPRLAERLLAASGDYLPPERLLTFRTAATLLMPVGMLA